MEACGGGVVGCKGGVVGCGGGVVVCGGVCVRVCVCVSHQGMSLDVLSACEELAADVAAEGAHA